MSTVTTPGVSRVAPSNGNSNGHLSNGRVKQTLDIRPILQSIGKLDYKNIWPFDLESSRQYLDTLIASNVILKNNTDRGNLIAFDIQNLLDWISSKHPQEYIKLAQVIKSFEEKSNMIRGVIFSGGGMRVMSEIGGAVTVNMIVELLGISYNESNKKPSFCEFVGSSGGSIIAALLALRASMQCADRFCEHDFSNLYGNPVLLEHWLETSLDDGYYKATGNHINFKDTSTRELLDQFGSKLYLLIGQKGDGYLPERVFYLPDHIEGFKPPKIPDLRPAKTVRASANLELLFGRNSRLIVKDETGKKISLTDPAFLPEEVLPLHIVKNSISDYARGKTNAPYFYFVVGNRKPWVTLKENNFAGKLPYNKLLLASYLERGLDVYNYFSPSNTERSLNKLGISKAFISSTCRTINPNNPSQVIKLGTGTLQIKPEELKAIVQANILESINQLHENLIDMDYLTSKGSSGKSAYALYKNDIDRANGLVKRQSSQEKTMQRELFDLIDIDSYHSAIALAKRGLDKSRDLLRTAASFLI